MRPQELREVLAENIRVLATERGVALTALADFAAVSRAQLFAVLAGTAGPSIDWLAKLAAALEVEPWRLLVPPDARARARRR